MGSKKKISYRLKLFLPLVGILWLIIVSFTLIHVKRERGYKSDTIRARVDFINNRILDLYNSNGDSGPFVRFIEEYFRSSDLEDMSVAIYDTQTSKAIIEIGFDAPTPFAIRDTSGTYTGEQLIQVNEREMELSNPQEVFYYKEDRSNDGRIIVQTILPFNQSVAEMLRISPWWWVLILTGGAAMTIITYLTTMHLTRNVRALSEFATNAAKDQNFVAVDNFANDDLGEISRQIVNIYNSRNAAIISRELEHRVALKATEERSTLKRQMTNNISHELKTPVGIVKGYIDTLVDNPDMDESSRIHFLTKSQAQIERLCNLLNDLSTITRLEEGGKTIQLEEIDFNEFLDNIEKEITESGITKGMKFVREIPSRCRIKGNNNLLAGAILNLIKNAVNYSHGTEIGIKLLTQNQRFYTFTFYDNGNGVPEEHIPHLFERFYRVDSGRSRKNGGTGLGLPIVRSSINTMGGSVTVRNREEGGLEIVFTLNIWHPKKESPTERHPAE